MFPPQMTFNPNTMLPSPNGGWCCGVRHAACWPGQPPGPTPPPDMPPPCPIGGWCCGVRHAAYRPGQPPGAPQAAAGRVRAHHGASLARRGGHGGLCGRPGGQHAGQQVGGGGSQHACCTVVHALCPSASSMLSTSQPVHALCLPTSCCCRLPLTLVPPCVTASLSAHRLLLQVHAVWCADHPRGRTWRTG